MLKRLVMVTVILIVPISVAPFAEATTSRLSLDTNEGFAGTSFLKATMNETTPHAESLSGTEPVVDADRMSVWSASIMCQLVCRVVREPGIKLIFLCLMFGQAAFFIVVASFTLLLEATAFRRLGSKYSLVGNDGIPTKDILIALSSVFLFVYVGYPVLVGFIHRDFFHVFSSSHMNVALWPDSLGLLLLLLASLVIVQYRLGGRIADMVRTTLRGNSLRFIDALMIFAAMLLLSDLCVRVLYGMPRSNMVHSPVELGLAFLVAPVAEELFFRGVALRAFSRRVGLLTGVILSSFMFAMFHDSAGVLCLHFILGVGLAVIFVRTRSLIAPICVHSLMNMLIFLMLRNRSPIDHFDIILWLWFSVSLVAWAIIRKFYVKAASSGTP